MVIHATFVDRSMYLEFVVCGGRGWGNNFNGLSCFFRILNFIIHKLKLINGSSWIMKWRVFNLIVCLKLFEYEYETLYSYKPILWAYDNTKPIVVYYCLVICCNSIPTNKKAIVYKTIVHECLTHSWIVLLCQIIELICFEPMMNSSTKLLRQK